MKKVFIVIAVLFTSLTFSQERNTIFAEFLGSAVFYSFNYERNFTDDISARIGIGPAERYIGIPLQMVYNVKIDKTHHLALGIGATYFYWNFDFHLFDFDDDDEDDEQTIERTYPVASLTYRIQTNTGLQFRFSFTPFYSNKEIQPWGGAGIGFRF